MSVKKCWQTRLVAKYTQSEIFEDVRNGAWYLTHICDKVCVKHVGCGKSRNHSICRKSRNQGICNIHQKSDYVYSQDSCLMFSPNMNLIRPPGITKMRPHRQISILFNRTGTADRRFRIREADKLRSRSHRLNLTYRGNSRIWSQSGHRL